MCVGVGVVVAVGVAVGVGVGVLLVCCWCAVGVLLVCCWCVVGVLCVVCCESCVVCRGGGGGADSATTSVSLSIRAHAYANKLLRTSASAPVPSAGLTSRKKPYALSLRRQVPGVPGGTHHPTPSRGKRLRGTPSSLPTPSEEGVRNLFHRLEVECPWSGMLTGVTLLCVFLVRRTLLAKLPLSPTK